LAILRPQLQRSFTTLAFRIRDDMYVFRLIPQGLAMNRTFALSQGIEAADLTGIEEAYSVKLVPDGFYIFTVNVSAENIPRLFRRLASEVNDPAFWLLELPTHRDVEEQLRMSPSDPFHRDVWYRDGLTWPEAQRIFDCYEYLFTHDGEVNFGFGSHSGHDEVLVGAYKVFQQTPGRRSVLTSANPTIWQMAEQLKTNGLYLAERRPD
jgi:hypothetical protein